ncbi:GNAT family N-acetyltransferase [candidate division KSB1 bacterium]|nr:GNAT family N-acetyltransferase [candidate division KSB1 bacterium]
MYQTESPDMRELNLSKIISSKQPAFLKKLPDFITNFIIKILERLLHVREIEQFLQEHSDKKDFEFIDAIFDYLDFSFSLSNKDYNRIPAEGKVICVANHPLGGLDALALLKGISQVRKDIKIIANDVLANIPNLDDIFLPFDIFSRRPQKSQVKAIETALLQDKLVIFFPAAEVSRFTVQGIRDKKWQKGALYFARKQQIPILPAFIKARNSFWFYFVSIFFKSFSMFLLVQEILKKRGKTITLKIGDPIPGLVFHQRAYDLVVQTRLLRRHVYRIGKNKSGLYKTEKTIIHPVDRKWLKAEISGAEKLISVDERKKLHVVDYKNAENVIKEIGRLREVTFRKVGEGTGEKSDLDKFDKTYRHIVLWDEEQLEIIGSYRLGFCKEIMQTYGNSGLYNASLFDFHDAFIPYLEQGVELGRSFIQEKYWKSNALDLLWQGIALVVFNKANIKYLYGAVSISDNYSNYAKSLIVYYYQKWYASEETLASAKNRFTLSKQEEAHLKEVINADNPIEDLKILKQTLRIYGYSIPILFRQYVELCDEGGVQFLDFSVDPHFSNCVDGLILLRLDKLKAKKRERYFPKQK